MTQLCASDHFTDATQIIPAIVLDGVNDEVCNYLSFLMEGNPAGPSLYAHLRGDATLSVIETKTGEAFEADPDFKKAMAVSDPRPAYYGYMRKWVAAEMQQHFPKLYARLPASFLAGAPLP